MPFVPLLGSHQSLQTRFLAFNLFFVCILCTQMQCSEWHIVKIPAVKRLHAVVVPFPTTSMKAMRKTADE